MTTEQPETRRTVLVVSHVLPFPGNAGQQQRVAYTLRALRPIFEVTFLTLAAPENVEQVREDLRPWCDEPLVLTALYSQPKSSLWHKGLSVLRGSARGLRRSNYIIGELEFSARRMRQAVGDRRFDLVLYEYWHAAASTEFFRSRNIPCVLDMHDVLWRSYSKELDEHSLSWLVKPLAIPRYRRHESRAWGLFDGVVAVNRAEEAEVKKTVTARTRVFHAAMGIDLRKWQFSNQVATPTRVGFYGGLGSIPNRGPILRCLHEVMPRIWRHVPSAELWFVGSNPPQFLRDAASDPRIHVTGFVPEPGAVLSTMSVVLCPWQGRYGFRSRLIEVMAVGVPVVASPDAVYGMELRSGAGLLLAESEEAMAQNAVLLLSNPGIQRMHSNAARAQVEERFSFQMTYGQLINELDTWLTERTRRTAVA